MKCRLKPLGRLCGRNSACPVPVGHAVYLARGRCRGAAYAVSNSVSLATSTEHCWQWSRRTPAELVVVRPQERQVSLKPGGELLLAMTCVSRSHSFRADFRCSIGWDAGSGWSPIEFHEGLFHGVFAEAVLERLLVGGLRLLFLFHPAKHLAARKVVPGGLPPFG